MVHNTNLIVINIFESENIDITDPDIIQTRPVQGATSYRPRDHRHHVPTRTSPGTSIEGPTQ